MTKHFVAFYSSTIKLIDVFTVRELQEIGNISCIRHGKVVYMCVSKNKNNNKVSH